MSIQRVIFAGTPEFAEQTLREIYNQGFEVVGVFTQPDRKSGRGKKVTQSAVKTFALSQNLEVHQPEKISSEVELIQSLQADIMIVVAFGQLIPQQILDIPKYGCLNIHASLLPRWRGAAPIQRAILAGDTTTGVGIMQMDTGLDTGDVLLEEKCSIELTDTAQTLHDKLIRLGKSAITATLNNIDTLTSTKQIGDSTYARKLTKDEAVIDWSNTAGHIDRQIRAFNPYPIAQTTISSDKFEAKVLRILSAKIVEKSTTEIYQDKNQLIINCSDFGLSLETVQLAGKKPVSIKDFNNAYADIILCL